MLTTANVDTLIIAGCSTGGCVRSTAIDASAHGYRPIVPEQCIDERSDELHQVNMFEINKRFGDVRPLAEVTEYFSDPDEYSDPL